MKKSSIAVQIEKEHQCLKRDMGEIHREVMMDIRNEDFQDWRLEFMWRLRDFRNHLLKHFDLEEEGGFMNEILTEKPEAMGQVKRLEAEHDDILASLDTILRDLKIMQKKEIEKLQDIRKRVVTLISSIQAHESAENELIQSVYYREYGYPS
ncbi:MAG: hemerythrin domain-containing protein [bacterium]